MASKHKLRVRALSQKIVGRAAAREVVKVVHPYSKSEEVLKSICRDPRVARGGFSVWPEQEMAICHGRTADADLFASAIAHAVLGDHKDGAILR